MTVKKKTRKRPRNPPGKSIAARLKERGSFDDRRYQFQICSWIAGGYTTKEIVGLFEEQYDIAISPFTIDSTYKAKAKWKKIINRMRDVYLKNVSRVDIANKGFRLRGYSTAFHRTILNKPAIAIQALDAARKEIEGDGSVHINVEDNRKFTQVHIENRSGAELWKDISERLRGK
ncbi:MAG: hypothetical protein HQ579_06080 [Candidatus Omnitrophica bacterium]|nr:hypothetical protein [Candidatus Omnitrophota bacterium]